MSSDTPEETRERITMTMTEETAEWLTESYPDALEIQEAIRMAISDARRAHDVEDDLDLLTDASRHSQDPSDTPK